MSTPNDVGADLWAGFAALDNATTSELVWEEPIPLTARRELPVFPTEVFPPWLREFVEAVAEETQTPVDMAGSLALAVLATAAGGRAVVHIRGRWREPTNLFVVVALPPGNRKSAVFSLMTNPLYKAEALLATEAAGRIVEAELTARLATEAADQAATKAARAEADKRDELVAEAVGLAQAAEAVTVPARPRLLADDATPEVIASLLAEQGGKLSVMSAEGGIFDIIAGRYSGTPNMEVFLRGQAGDRLRVDRRGREEFIEAPALTMGLTVQPSVLEDIGRIKGAGDRGLLARFFYSLPVSLVGHRKILPDTIPDTVADTYEESVTALTLSLAGWTDPAVLQLSPDAGATLVAYEERQEPRLRERGGDLGHVRNWASKLGGATCRLAGLLHLSTHPDNGHTQPISADTMRAAVKLSDYFTGHALTVFELMGADHTANRACTVLETLRANQWAEVSKRDLMVKLSRSEFPTVADLDPALDLLEDHGYLRLQPVQRTAGRGRPPSPRCLIHPQLSAPAV
ncbi:YfjI family protein [Streptomyces sp. H27-D2]|uniref:YfjI family protein n=1 Tax=Streptomyces sp. H27-D2 TaxID=3046304 RepID=UPI002DBAD795|nr:YfjI family protein [Streptomyces sp. H27-D2]MEC4014942.1 YfjI family protein [Streptomyces sp. H27-D2]